MGVEDWVKVKIEELRKKYPRFKSSIKSCHFEDAFCIDNEQVFNTLKDELRVDGYKFDVRNKWGRFSCAYIFKRQ